MTSSFSYFYGGRPYLTIVVDKFGSDPQMVDACVNVCHQSYVTQFADEPHDIRVDHSYERSCSSYDPLRRRFEAPTLVLFPRFDSSRTADRLSDVDFFFGTRTTR